MREYVMGISVNFVILLSQLIFTPVCRDSDPSVALALSEV